MKLVVVFSDQAEAETVAKSFHACGCEIAAIASQGTDALSLCCDLQPDCLITEPFLPYLNCDEIAGILEQKCAFPLVKVVLSPEKNDLMAGRFMVAGGDIFLRTPFDVSYTVRRIESFLGNRRSTISTPTPAQTLSYLTGVLLERMKMPASLQGYRYLEDAICLIAEDETMLQQLVSKLYPTIADLRSTTPGGVERCIRNAISLTFERGDADYLYPRFGHAVKPSTGRPTNGEFIAILAELVRNELRS